MSVKACLIRRADGLWGAATATDAEILGSLKQGRAYTFEVKQMSNRSYQHHKLFFGGLLPLAYQYWQPEGGLVTQWEENAVMGFARRLEALSENGGLWLEFAGDYLANLARRRGEKVGAVVQDIDEFRRWLTIQAGYFEFVQTPAGIRKRAMSLGFASMSQEEFNAFYKAAFNVAWNMMLCKQFDTEEEAHQAALEMMELGG